MTVVYIAAAFAGGLVLGIEIAVVTIGHGRRRGGMVELDTPRARRRIGGNSW